MYLRGGNLNKAYSDILLTVLKLPLMQNYKFY